MKNLTTTLATFSTFLMLSACSDTNADRAKRVIEKDLRDPSSVQYRNVKGYVEGLVCGEFNAKNGLGGYVGFTNFIWDSENPNDVQRNPDAGEFKFWCSDYPEKRIKRKETEKLLDSLRSGN